MALFLDAAQDHIPRFTWRVVSSRSRYYQQAVIQGPMDVDLPNLDHDGRRALRSCISAHMVGNHYDAPYTITSLTGSLLWALNYAHWLVRKGNGGVQIFLVDSRRIPEGRMYPAAFLAAYLEVAPLGIPWHDDPYHEYFVFGGIAGDAILGCVDVNHQSLAGREINRLLPGFSQVNQQGGLHASLERLIMIHQNTIFRNVVRLADVSDDDVLAASMLAERFLSDEADPINQGTLFQITMMFLSLRKRMWNANVWARMLRVFQGASIPGHIPQDYLYRSRGFNIRGEMPDVVEWVTGMEFMRIECVMARVLQRLTNALPTVRQGVH